MSYATQGSSNRQIYDCCNYDQYLTQSTDPFQYEMYFGKEENCHKCIDKKAWFKQDTAIVNRESELMNITRPLSDCSINKYNPNCKKSPSCISTFDPSNPIILPQNLCSITYNNIPRVTDPGYTLPKDGYNFCRKSNQFTEVDSVNTYNSYNATNQKILNGNTSTQSVNMFMNSCSTTPLYNNQMNNVGSYDSSMRNKAPVNTNSLFATMFGYGSSDADSDNE